MSTMTFLTQQQEVGAELRLDIANQPEHATLVKRWLNQSQQDIWSRYDWPWALDREIVQTVTDVTSGTVSLSAGGTIVTGSSTSFSSGDVGKYIRFSSSDDWYKITAVSGTTSLTIEAPYVGTSALSGGTYRIRKIFYSLSSSVEKVMDVRQAISPIKLTLIPFRSVDLLRPDPDSTGSPEVIVPFGYDSSNNWTFSLLPYPDAVMNLEFRTKKKATDLSSDSDVSVIPEKWHSTVMLDGALARGYEYVAKEVSDSRAARKRVDFERGIERMIADAYPDSDYHLVLGTPERRMGIDQIIRFPAKYG